MAVNCYSPDCTDPLETDVIAQLNQVLAAAAAANGAAVADAFTAFQVAASKNAGGQTCVTGWLNANPQNELLCDDHASQFGQHSSRMAIVSAYRAASVGGAVPPRMTASGASRPVLAAINRVIELNALD